MSTGSFPGFLRRRPPGRSPGPGDRRALESAGWRTTLDYLENHVRAQDGTLVRVEPVWVAAADRLGTFREESLSASASSAAVAWARLRRAADRVGDSLVTGTAQDVGEG